MTRKLDDVRVGDALPALPKAAITTRQLVEYAGASGDFNRIHYDEPFAREAGHPKVIAHGMLSMAFFGQLLADWAGPQAIVRLAARFKAVSYPGDVITVEGEVTAKDDARRTVEVKLSARNQAGTVTLEGAATVRLD
jgi:peroxisomal enoyl-CoA hydratase 2